MGDEDSSPRRSTLSNIDDRTEMGDVDLRIESGGELEMKARVKSSAALRLDWFARAFRLALDVVMEGSVAEARSSLGLLLLAIRSAESLRCMWEDVGVKAGERVAIMVACGNCL